MPFELLMASAQLESGFRTDAKATTSSAMGLFQFTEQTWLDTMRRHGAEHGMAAEASAIVDSGNGLTTSDPATRRRILDLRNNASIASSLAGDHLHDLATQLNASLGRTATSGEIYLGNFLGAHGAKQIISAPPSQIAANVLPRAAKANATLFYAQDGTPYTASQFLQHMQARVNQAFANVDATSGSAALAADNASAGAASTGVANAASNKGTPTLRQSAPEQVAMASLTATFVQADWNGTVSKPHNAKRQAEMPAALLTGLQMIAPQT